MMPVIHGLDPGQDEAGRRPERMDVAAAGVDLRHAGRGGREGIAVAQHGFPGAQERQGAAVVRDGHAGMRGIATGGRAGAEQQGGIKEKAEPPQERAAVRDRTGGKGRHVGRAWETGWRWCYRRVNGSVNSTLAPSGEKRFSSQRRVMPIEGFATGYRPREWRVMRVSCMSGVWKHRCPKERSEGR